MNISSMVRTVGAVALLIAAVASAESFPNKPFRILVPFSAGSATDILARLIGPRMLEHWGEQVIVDNRPSAAGIIAGEIVAKAAPDGYTLLLSSSAFAGSAALGLKMPYDSVKDFAGITQIVTTPLVVVVAPSLGVKSLKELIALAKSNPGKINFASSGIGSGTHYASELFRLAAGIDTVHVPYKGTPEGLNDTIAGRIEYYIAPVLPTIPLIKSERLLALATSGTERMAMLPDVPTIAEAALPGFVYDGWFGVFAPAKTPRTIINSLAKEIARIMALAEVKERIASLGAVVKTSTPAEFDKLVRSEIAKRAEVFGAPKRRGDETSR
jgi:tripartite-type tricarboxylate transporter receptor subunit TctC